MKWTLAGQLGVVALLALLILHAEGAKGFIPLLAAEALVWILGGTLLLSLPRLALPKRERLPAFLSVAQANAELIGALGTILGAILMLHSIDDIAALPRRLSLCLASLFHGLFLSRVLLAPWARSPGNGAPPGRGIPPAGAAAVAALIAMFTPLWALSACAGRPAPPGVALALPEDGRGLEELAPALARFAVEHDIRLIARPAGTDEESLRAALARLRDLKKRLERHGVPAQAYAGRPSKDEPDRRALTLRIVQPPGPIGKEPIILPAEPEERPVDDACARDEDLFACFGMSAP